MKDRETQKKNNINNFNFRLLSFDVCRASDDDCISYITRPVIYFIALLSKSEAIFLIFLLSPRCRILNQDECIKECLLH